MYNCLLNTFSAQNTYWAAKLTYIFTPFSSLSSFCHLISAHYHYITLYLRYHMGSYLHFPKLLISCIQSEFIIKSQGNNMYLLIPKSGLSLMTCVDHLEVSKAPLCGLPRSNSNFKSRGGPYSKEKDHGDFDVSWDLYLIFNHKFTLNT